MTNLEALKYLYVKCGGMMTDVHDWIRADPVGDYTISADVISALGSLMMDRVLPLVDGFDDGKTLIVQGGVWSKAELPVIVYVSENNGAMYKDFAQTERWKNHEFVDAVYAAKGQIRMAVASNDYEFFTPQIKYSDMSTSFTGITAVGENSIETLHGSFGKVSADGNASCGITVYTLTPDA